MAKMVTYWVRRCTSVSKNAFAHPLQLQLGMHPRQHHERADRFGDVIDRAEFEALHLIFDFRFGGKKDDRGIHRFRVRL